MPLQPGARLGPYEILEPIGSGGMGEVYRGHDPRLDRAVAIKVLAGDYSTDAERVQRFEQEARATATLNHPHIVAVHDVGQHEGVPYIVSELLEGETLRERLRTGPVPPRKAIEYAIQIARGLSAAHDKGIVHRDLKPENIFITLDGRAKILDFGLAKLIEAGAPLVRSGLHTASMTGLPTAAPNTIAGVVLGTIGYMSPEQVRGTNADHRADIFAFGAILYEMLSGQRAFAGATPADTMTAILREDPPDPPESEPRIPPGLVRIVDRCLEKNPGSRFQSAGDLAFALESASSASGSAIAIGGGTPARTRERLAWGIAALFAIAAFVLAARQYLSSGSAPERVIHAIVPPPDDWVVSSQQAPMRLAVSPDGTRIAFIASTVEKPVRTQLWVRRFDSLSAQAFAGTDNALGPFWSPDSRFIGFFADGKLKKIDSSGGPAIILCDAIAGIGPATGATWNQDDVILLAVGGRGLSRVSAAGGTPTVVTDPQGVLHHLPFFLPDGRHFLYRISGRLPATASEGSQIHLGSLDSGDSRLLVRDTAQAMFSQGHVLYARDGTLMAQPFDERRFELSGEPFPVAERVLTGAGGPSVFSVSRNGVLVYQQGPVQRGFRLTWVDRTGKPVAALDEGLYGDLQLSSDGKRVAVSLGAGAGNLRDIWIFERGLKTKFTSNPANENGVIWSPDDQRIIFGRAGAKSGRDLILKASTNVGAEEVLLADGAENSPASWSLDGQFVLFGTIGRETGQDLWVLPLAGDRKPRPFAASEAGEAGGRFSPDGRWVAYRSQETGQAEIFIAPFPGPGKKIRVSGEGGANPKWRRDGRELFYLSADGIMAVDVDLRGTEPVFGTPHALFSASMARVGVQSWYDVTPDGQQFLINAMRDTLGPVPFTIISNWLAARRK